MEKRYINIMNPKNMVIRELVFSTDPTKYIGYGSEAVSNVDAPEEVYNKVYEDIMAKIKMIKEK